VDSNVPAQESDRQLIDWLRAAGRDFAVVATKIDRLSGNERTRNLLALKKGLELDEVLPVSAKTGYGVKELWARIEAWLRVNGSTGIPQVAVLEQVVERLRRLLLVHGVGVDGRAHHVQIFLEHRFLGLPDGALKARHGDHHEYADDRHHDQQLDQRKARVLFASTDH
jgi:50S ribosomal subunit-associated GTPase HflX